ncbi:MAG TPA: tRNA (adenosine(37)-N6)-dimethylallyltransferase MiaA [Aquificales bacterium]|nr:tRNA (adenosine(37)-N6)-dimethylallyltransferase MiaA [Aquificales bacterium]
MEVERKPLIVIGGATGVGKTELSLQLARAIGGEIISADSMAVYKYMDIGTAKPSPAERRAIRHYLIDVVEPNETFSIKQFIDLADEAVREIWERGKVPIVVGGTYMYIHPFLFGLAETPPGDWELRKKLYERAEREGKDKLWEELLKIDPQYAAKIHPNDLRRIVRALEVYTLTGKPYSSFHTNWENAKPRYPYLGVFLYRPWEEQYRRIRNRVWDMIRDGLLGEIRRLLDMGFKEAITSPQAIDYKEFIPYFEGRKNLLECIGDTIRHTKEQAKRQIRWFKRYNDWLKLDLSKISTPEAVERIIREYRRRFSNGESP